MDEIGFLGIGISTIANLAVAAGTIGLAIGTYFSLIAYRREKERPIIFEFIKSQLKAIRNDIDHDVWVIDRNMIDWSNDQSPGHRNNLLFPVSREKDFHLGFKKEIMPWFLQGKPILSSHVNSISKNLIKRSESYAIIEKNLELLVDELAPGVFNQFIGTSIKTGEQDYDYFCLQKEEDSNSDEEFYSLWILEKRKINKNDFMNDIKNLIIIALFPSCDDYDNRLSKHNHFFLGHQLITIIEWIKSILPSNDKISQLKSNIETQIIEMKAIDSEILDEIALLIKSLQNTYLFTNEEMA